MTHGTPGPPHSTPGPPHGTPGPLHATWGPWVRCLHWPAAAWPAPQPPAPRPGAWRRGPARSARSAPPPLPPPRLPSAPPRPPPPPRRLPAVHLHHRPASAAAAAAVTLATRSAHTRLAPGSLCAASLFRRPLGRPGRWHRPRARVLLASHAAPLARVVEHHVVVQLDRALAGSACGAEDDVELDVGAAHRLVGPAPCHAAAHRASREGSATDKGRHVSGGGSEPRPSPPPLASKWTVCARPTTPASWFT